MDLTEYASYDAVGLADLLRRGEVEPAELRRCAARAVELLDPRLNAVIELYADRVALGDPEASPNGPLSGVPFFLKDIGATERGRRCEMGSRMLRGYVAAADSFLTARFKAAGLVNLGRTTTPEAGFAGTTESVLTGATRNPWSLELSAGGSSGGSAAAVAAGIVPIAHGSDGAGSLRIPAAVCGLVALKPSRGRVSFGPEFDEPQLGCACEFALTRTVRDSAALLDAVAMPCPGDPFVLRRPARSYAEEMRAPQQRLRIAFTTTSWFTGRPVPAELAAATVAAARDCESMGHDVEEAAPAFDAHTAYAANRLAFDSTLLLLEPFAQLLGAAPDEDHLEPVVLDAYRKVRALTATDFFLGMLRFNVTRREIGAFFERYDVLVTPTLAVPSIALGTFDCSSFATVEEFRDASERTVFTFTAPFNVTGQPAVSLPLGMTTAGTPIGVQFVGRFGEEEVLLRLAAAFEELRPWRGRRPPLHAATLRHSTAAPDSLARNLQPRV